MHLCLVEDTLSEQFLPLTHFRPVFDLRCGILTMRERIHRSLRPRAVSLHARHYLRTLIAEESPDAEVGSVSSARCLVVNGRCLMTPSLARTLRGARPGDLFTAGGEFVAAMVEGRSLEELRAMMAGDAFDGERLPCGNRREVDAALLRRPWDLIARNEEVLRSDFALLGASRRPARRQGMHRTAVLLAPGRISLGRDSRVGPGAVLDATGGPIRVGKEAVIHPHAVIEGPASIGEGAVIKAGARIGGATTIGPVCKVGGEIEHSILHSHANKQHDGFLGHSYLGMWVNLGAGTTTSNLKNTYGTVSVRIGGRAVDTGLMFLGLIAGDHTKTGINVSLDTGTVIGASCNVYGALLPPKEIPSFTWGTAGRLTTYEPEKALEVAGRAMARRGVEATAAYGAVFHEVFQRTADDRAAHRS